MTIFAFDSLSRIIIFDFLSFVVSQIFPSKIVIDSQILTSNEVITIKNKLIFLLNVNNVIIVDDKILIFFFVFISTFYLHIINEIVIEFFIFQTLRLSFSIFLIEFQILISNNKITIQNKSIFFLSKNDEILVENKIAEFQFFTKTTIFSTSSFLTNQMIIDSTTYKYSMFSFSFIQIESQILKTKNVITINEHHVSFMFFFFEIYIYFFIIREK